MTAASPRLERVERTTHWERGQASVESVVLLPVLVVITFAMWQAALAGWTLVSAAMYAALAFWRTEVADVALPLLIGALSGYMILQSAQVRAAYPGQIVGRALALFTMSMFLGVAAMQWLTGVVASIAKSHELEIFAPVLLTIAVLLIGGAMAFAWLPRASRTVEASARSTEA